MEKENNKLSLKGGYSGMDSKGTLGTQAGWRRREEFLRVRSRKHLLYNHLEFLLKTDSWASLPMYQTSTCVGFTMEAILPRTPDDSRRLRPIKTSLFSAHQGS